ncbi:MAG: 4-hydroxy-3-methylbut-2-enyl diphosphate reductase [Phycisphaera sp.]|nr:MAG: 4-hydroxy-3-methylbut-2-enyl diphosphate reductase [Phycisphaera sp.]
MRLILPNPRGFCAGVRMAIDVVDRVVALYPNKTTYVYHEIVHNRHVVGRFKDQGVVFVEDLEDVPSGEVVVFSAHGIPPEIRKQADDRGLIAIDATCPLVTKVHSEAVRYARQGYQILLIGHENHQEVVGTRGEAPQATLVVESPEHAKNIQVKDESRLVYLTQTTLSTDDAGAIIRVLKDRFPHIHEPSEPDICYATTNRQHAVRQIAPEVDVVLVVGSRNSSNSVRLTEIARNVGTDAHLLDDASELRDGWFTKGADTSVLITAGASAPEDLVAKICKTLIDTHGGSIEQWDIVDESIEFVLPVALRRLMKEEGVEVGTGTVTVDGGVVSPEMYGAVPLTVSAKSTPPTLADGIGL